MLEHSPVPHSHRYERKWSPIDHDSSLSDLAQWIKPKSTVLELGSATGYFTRYLHEDCQCTVDAVEINPDMAEEARRWCRNLVVADLNVLDLSGHFERGAYQTVIAGDVLEHLLHPEQLLEQLPSLLSPDGELIASIPNAAYAGLLISLMQGRFDYREEGLLDRTHLRFFTRDSFSKLLVKTGYTAYEWRAVFRPLGESEFGVRLETLPTCVREAIAASPDALCYQWLVRVGLNPSMAEQQPYLPAVSISDAFPVKAIVVGNSEPGNDSLARVTWGKIGNPRQVLQLNLPPTVGNRLRIRLSDRPGYIHLYGIKLSNHKGQKYLDWTWHPGVDIPTRKNEGLAFIHTHDRLLCIVSCNEPWLEFDYSESFFSSGALLEIDMGWPMSSDYMAAIAHGKEFVQRDASQPAGLLAPPISKRYEILIPVFEAWEDTVACVESVIRHTGKEHTIRIGDDNSTDPRFDPWYAHLRRHGISVRKNKRNMGYLHNINAMLEESQKDVVLLNSDTMVTAGWIEKMDRCRSSSPAIGIVCPLSNNATLLSVPRVNTCNTNHPRFEASAIAQWLESRSPRYPRLPTAVGFCMLVTRKTIEALGFFDPVFQVGYAEECDYSMRAWRSGIEIACCDNAYVFHRGARSFGDAPRLQAKKRINREILNLRWPRYEAAVSAFCQSNPLRSLQEAMEAEQKRRCVEHPADNNRRECILVVAHRFESYGGVEEHIRDIANQLRGDFDFDILYPGPSTMTGWFDFECNRVSDWLRLARINPEIINNSLAYSGFSASIECISSESAFARFLKHHPAKTVHFQHVAGWGSLRLPTIAREIGKRVLVSLHDMFFLCPNYGMQKDETGTCDQTGFQPDSAFCRQCLSQALTHGLGRDVDISAYAAHRRELAEDALRAAHELIAPSEFVRRKYAEHFGDWIISRIRVIPHGIPDSVFETRNTPSVSTPTLEPLRIGFFGSFTGGKGAFTLLKALSFLPRHSVILEINGPVDLRLGVMLKHEALVFRGAYDRGEMNNRLKDIALGVVPSLLFETYCMVLAELQAARIPVIASRIGAIPERVVDGVTGFLFEPGDPEELAGIILRLNADRSRIARIREALAEIDIPSSQDMARTYAELYSRQRYEGQNVSLPPWIENLLAATSQGEIRKALGFEEHQGANSQNTYATESFCDDAFNRWIHDERARNGHASRQTAGLQSVSWVIFGQDRPAAWFEQTSASLRSVFGDYAKIACFSHYSDEHPYVPNVALPSSCRTQRVTHFSADSLLSVIGEFQTEWVGLIVAGAEFEPWVKDVLAPVVDSAVDLVYFDTVRSANSGECYAPDFKPDFDPFLLKKNQYLGECLLIRSRTLSSFTTSSSTPNQGFHPTHWIASCAAHMDPTLGVRHIAGICCRIPDEICGDASPQQIETREKNNSSRNHCSLDLIIWGGSLEDILTWAREIEAHGQLGNEPCFVTHEQEISGRESPIACNLVLSNRLESLAEALNVAASQGNADVLCFVKANTRARDTDWSAALFELMRDTSIDAVAGTLTTNQGQRTISAYVVGAGSTGIAAMAFSSSEQTGSSMSRLSHPQRVLAAPIEFFAVRRHRFLQLGQFNARAYPCYCFDIDFCLRLAKQGGNTIWSPDLSRIDLGQTDRHTLCRTETAETLTQERKQLYSDWGSSLAFDPSYNPCLSLHESTLWQPDPLFSASSLARTRSGAIRVLAYPFDDWGSGHYRIRSPLSRLDKQGDIRLIQMPGHANSRIATMPEVWRGQVDVIIAHNFFHDAELAAIEMYRSFGKAKIIIGMDDLITELPDYNPYSRLIYPNIEQRVQKALALADCLVVSSQALAEAYGKFVREVVVIPNALDETLWHAVVNKRKDQERIRVGWAGAKQHYGDLLVIEECVRETSAEIDWIFFGMCPDELRPFVKECHDMVPFEQYPEKLASLGLDIAVAPLTDNTFNRAKSQLKILEYAALGLPVVCSDIRPYQSTPARRVSNEAEAWIAAILELARNPDKRRQQGSRMKKWAQTEGVLSRQTGQWLSLFFTR